MEDAFLNERIKAMLKSKKWGFPLQALLQDIEREVEPTEEGVETEVEGVAEDLGDATRHLHEKSADWLSLFRGLEKANYGKLILGRRGFKTRFLWTDPPALLARSALAFLEDSTSPPGDIDAEPLEKKGAWAEYVFPLRRNVTVSVQVPTDITREELSRLADFIRLLPAI